MKRKVRFIINPVSGGKNKAKIPQLIEEACLTSKLDADICFSSSVEETLERTQQAVAQKFDAVIAVGGDGTINLIGSELIHTPVALGIIPMGSGNGLARSLGIPFSIKKAVNQIDQFQVKVIDTCSVNGTPFLNVAGIGFDAHVAGQFHHSQRRGLLTYVKIVLREFSRYTPETCTILADGKTFQTDAFLLTVCNGPQFGNNAYIAPHASLTDGLFHVTILKRCRWIDAPALAIRLFRGTIDQDPNTTCFSAQSIVVQRTKHGQMNIDGEPQHQAEKLHFEMHPLSLRVISA